MTFLIIAHDGTDEAALERRMAARPAHFERAAAVAASGRLVVGGAILDEAGKMIGSSLLLQVPDEAAARAWIAADPYSTGDVWREVEIRPFRIAPLPYHTLPQP